MSSLKDKNRSQIRANTFMVEEAMLRLFQAGKTNKEVAEALAYGLSTVERYRGALVLEGRLLPFKGPRRTFARYPERVDIHAPPGTRRRIRACAGKIGTAEFIRRAIDFACAFAEGKH
jgi:hypothetical protein